MYPCICLAILGEKPIELFWLIYLLFHSTGDAAEQQIPAGGKAGEGGKKLKPCCACPETKQARDECIVEKGEENCQKLIEAHKECLRKYGFKV